MKVRCDKLFSTLICRDKACLRCGSTPVECSHVIPRGYDATRCDITNAQPLCWECHRFFTDHTDKFTEWCKRTVPDYEELWKKAINYSKNPYPKVDWEEVYKELKLMV